MISFLTIALTINGLLHWFLYARLVSALSITSPTALWSLRFLALLLAFSYVIARVGEEKGPASVAYGMHWVSSFWMGLMLQLLWLSLLFYIVKLVLMLTGVWSGFPPETPILLGRLAFGVTLAVSLGLCSYATWRAAAPAVVVNVQIPVKQITPELRGLKILMASDFHTGVLIGENQLQHMVDQINAQHPDLILLPGDIVDRKASKIMSLAKIFRELKAPLGVFGTTGNHEYYVGVEPAVELCRQGGIQMLMNEHVILPNGLMIAGIEDGTALQFNRKLPSLAELVGDSARTHPVILLHHAPTKVKEAAEAGVDLMVSGHTHGGQIWPFKYLSQSAYPMNHGLFTVGTCHLFTSYGIGYWGPQMRLGAPPEIVIFHLVGEDEPAKILD